MQLPVDNTIVDEILHGGCQCCRLRAGLSFNYGELWDSVTHRDCRDELRELCQKWWDAVNRLEFQATASL